LRPAAADGARARSRIRAARPPKQAPDPWQPLGVLWERERTPERGVVPALTVFLAGAECPFTCVFCDLWRSTLDGPTPVGALAAQLRQALAAEPPARLDGALVKLYNASNFFDERAVPRADEAAMVPLLAPFSRVVVESHPRLVGTRCLEFAEALGGRLEVAMGLETVHPAALAGLNKGMTLADFDRAAGRLRAAGVSLRAFVLVGAPFVPAREAAAWAVRSAAHAFEHGVGTVALIPVRGGNGAMEALAAQGDFTPPELPTLEEALDGCLALGGGVVMADLWDFERLARCPACAGARRARLERLNLTGRPEPRTACGECGAGLSGRPEPGRGPQGPWRPDAC
jgi:archaeosine synthase beta-subunit